MIYLFIGILIIVGFITLQICLNEYRLKKRAYEIAKRKHEEAEKSKERKLLGKHIIEQAELMPSIKQVVRHAVKKVVREMQSCYMDCDETNIWLTGMFTFQLQCRLEKAYIGALNLTLDNDIDECKEFVREIIKTCHLEAVKVCPELKEY